MCIKLYRTVLIKEYNPILSITRCTWRYWDAGQPVGPRKLQLRHRIRDCLSHTLGALRHPGMPQLFWLVTWSNPFHYWTMDSFWSFDLHVTINHTDSQDHHLCSSEICPFCLMTISVFSVFRLIKCPGYWQWNYTFCEEECHARPTSIQPSFSQP